MKEIGFRGAWIGQCRVTYTENFYPFLGEPAHASSCSEVDQNQKRASGIVI